MSNVYMTVLKSNIEGNFNTYVFGKCLFLHFPELNMFVEHRDIYYAKRY